jgi:hypothetical protein
MVRGVTGGDYGSLKDSGEPGDPKAPNEPRDPGESSSSGSGAGGPAGAAGPGPGQGSAAQGAAGRPPFATQSGASRRHDEGQDEIPPDELAGGQPSGGAELTGMDLIQRELGGQVISEIQD